jgi:hypothetical protein
MEFFLNEVAHLEFDSEPVYAKIQAKLTDALKQLGHSSSAVDNFRLFSTKNMPKTPSTAHVCYFFFSHIHSTRKYPNEAYKLVFRKRRLQLLLNRTSRRYWPTKVRRLWANVAECPRQKPPLPSSTTCLCRTTTLTCTKSRRRKRKAKLLRRRVNRPRVLRKPRRDRPMPSPLSTVTINSA